MQKRHANGGVFVEYGSHTIDLARWLGGPLRSVVAHGMTLIPSRPTPAGPGRVELDDDASWIAIYERVSIVVNFEEGAERSLLDGDDRGESFGDITYPMPSGVRDLAAETNFEYGRRVGVWRLLDTFARHEIPTTFFACGRALERTPEVGRALAELGHEPCSHGCRWGEHFHLSEEERAEIRDAVIGRYFATAEAFYDYAVTSLDQLWDEGDRTPVMLSVGLHARISGRPGRARGLDRFIAYARSKGGVWFARRDEIARFWLSQYPPSEGDQPHPEA